MDSSRHTTSNKHRSSEHSKASCRANPMRHRRACRSTTTFFAVRSVFAPACLKDLANSAAPDLVHGGDGVDLLHPDAKLRIGARAKEAEGGIYGVMVHVPIVDHPIHDPMVWALQELLGQELSRPKCGRCFILFLTLRPARKPNEQGCTHERRDKVSFGNN